MKPAAEIVNISRVPSARDRYPDSGIEITSAIRYEVCTHEISSADAARPAWISDNDAETIWISRNAMNMPTHMARNAASRRGSMRSSVDGSAAALDAVSVLEADMARSRCGYLTAAVFSGWTYGARRGRAPARVSTLTTTDMPGRSAR